VVGPSGIDLPSLGVYPVELLVTDASSTVLARLVTYLLYLPAPGNGQYPPLSVAVVMELGGPPGLQPDGTVQLDNAMVGDINDRIDALTQASGVPITLAPVPETLDALAEAGPQGTNLLKSLHDAVGTSDVLARPYVDLDLDALAAAGLLSQTSAEAMAGAQVL